MLPTTGETCLFTFKSTFTSLNGIYKVLSINTLDELIALGVDMVASSYEKVGLSETEYQEEVLLFKHERIYKLSHVTTSDVIYIPTSFFLTIPDPHIREYLHLGFAVNVGIFKDMNKIDWIKNQIGQALKAVAGVEKEPSLFELRSTWLTEAEFAVIESERNALISNTSNHYSDKQILLSRIARLNTIVAEYERTIKLLQ